MADSDVRVTPDMLSTIAAEFQDQRLGLATCPYRAVPGRSFWSTLEAIGLNTEFIGGVLVARMLDGMKFALGPTIAARRETLARHRRLRRREGLPGGRFRAWASWRPSAAYGVILSSYVIEHRIGAQPFAANCEASPALEPQHAPLAPLGLYRPGLHLSAAAGAVCCGRRGRLVARGGAGRGLARRRRMGHRRPLCCAIR